MAYSVNFQISARRHFLAAESLYSLSSPGAQPPARAVAGYLYGVAGELAVKRMMITSGMRPLESRPRRDDPFYMHFPELKTALRDNASGRRAADLLTLAQSDHTFREWSTNMRYAPTSEVTARLVDGWKDDAKKLIDQMETE